MTLVPFGEFLPDRPDLSEGTIYASGCIPLTPDSYGPLRTLNAFSTNALTGPCIGLGAMEDINENVQTFAGTQTDLFLLASGTTTWQSVSGGTGGPGSPLMDQTGSQITDQTGSPLLVPTGSYTTNAGENWRFAQFNEIVLATNYTNPIQSFTMGSSNTFNTLSSNAPNARYIAVVKGFAIVANTSDPVGGINPARLWWCANGDPTNWPTPGSTQAQEFQSDYNDLLGPQGGITGLVPSLAGCDCAVFFERAVWQMFYVGPPDIFNFYPCAAVKGVPAPNSLVALGSYVYGLFEDGFYAFDGSSATPIGVDKVDRWFFNNVNLLALNQVIGAPDIGNKTIVWLFQSNKSVNGQPDMALIYRWDIGRWSTAPLAAQWVARVPVPSGVAAIPPYTTGLVSGQLQLAAIDQNQKLAYFNGKPMQAQIGTRVAQITPGGRTYVQSVRPLIDGQPPSSPYLNEDGSQYLNEDGTPYFDDGAGPTVTVAVSARTNYTDVETFGPQISVNLMGECPQRADGRYLRGLANISGGIWDYAYGLDVTAIGAGLR